jgi:hypothetical protein
MTTCIVRHHMWPNSEHRDQCALQQHRADTNAIDVAQLVSVEHSHFEFAQNRYQRY